MGTVLIICGYRQPAQRIRGTVKWVEVFPELCCGRCKTHIAGRTDQEIIQSWPGLGRMGPQEVSVHPLPKQGHPHSWVRLFGTLYSQGLMTAKNGGATTSLDSRVTLFSWSRTFFLLSHLSLPYYSLAFIATKMHCWLVFSVFSTTSQASWTPGCGRAWGRPVLGIGLCTCLC